jgi:hypothetical protein
MPCCDHALTASVAPGLEKCALSSCVCYRTMTIKGCPLLVTMTITGVDIGCYGSCVCAPVQMFELAPAPGPRSSWPGPQELLLSCP